MVQPLATLDFNKYFFKYMKQQQKQKSQKLAIKAKEQLKTIFKEVNVLINYKCNKTTYEGYYVFDYYSMNIECKSKRNNILVHEITNKKTLVELENSFNAFFDGLKSL